MNRIGMPDSFIEHGTAADQRRRLQLDAEGIAGQVLEAFFSETEKPGRQKLLFKKRPGVRKG